MLDLQNQSSVLTRLEDRPHYTFTVFPGSSLKQFYWYNVYYRSVIDFSLTCEYEPSGLYTKATYLTALKNSYPKNLIPTQKTEGATMLVSFIIISIALALVGKKNLEYLLVVLVVYVVTFVYMIAGPLSAFGKAYANNINYAYSLRSLSQFNQCVD